MRRTRRSFTPEYRFTAAHRVIDGKERVVDVARELNLNDSVLHTWVRDERWRMSADSAGRLLDDPSGGEPLLPKERAELVRLRKQVAEQAETIAFLANASAYCAAQLNSPEFRAHFLAWEGWRDAQQARREPQGQGGFDGDTYDRWL
ncbi:MULTISPECIES: transposase [Mycobacterium]|uniref:transposase n=1 Tax=Mycobacterium TaxID=1763 RepID=UPI001CD94862|nr:transposase [Mycobacterium sp. WUMAC-067]MCA2313742.1 transposase [Mycobacterium sp. WUMAC-025]